MQQVSWSYLILFFFDFLQQSAAANLSKEACHNLQPKLECESDSRNTQTSLCAVLGAISDQDIWVAYKHSEVIAVNMAHAEGLVSLLTKAIAPSSGDAHDAQHKAQLIVYTYNRDSRVSAALAHVHE